MTKGSSTNSQSTPLDSLQRREARMLLINSHAPFFTCYVDKDEIVRYANKSYANWHCQDENIIVGRKLKDVVGPSVYSQIHGFVRQGLDGNHVSYEYQIVQNEKTAYARSSLVPEIDDSEEVYGLFIFSYDITDQRLMQTALIKAQKMEAIGQLTGGLAHDFNNLLTVIIGNLATYASLYPGNADIEEYIEPALQSARRGAQLVKRLQTFSRQNPVEPESIHVASLIENVSKLIRGSMPKKISIKTDVENISSYVLVDPAQLESALINFALNSRDAMPNGGELTISAQSLVLSSNKNAFDIPGGNYVEIIVSDTGTGMSAESLARVFEPFYTTKGFGLGSGLGLPTAFGFAKQSGGGLHIQSELGKGTSVHLALPQTKAPETLEVYEEEIDINPDGALILLVEDETNVRRIVRKQLLNIGYMVIEAENGEIALQMIAQIPEISLVLSDIIMPGGMNGRQLAAKIRNSYPHIPVALMSGYHEDRSSNAGGTLPVLTKPFDDSELVRALNQSKAKL